MNAAEPAGPAATFWTAARAGRPALQRCTACRRFRWFPAAICPYCLGSGAEWETVSGEAQVYACSAVHRAPGPNFVGQAPYVIVLADLTEGVRVMGRLVGGWTSDDGLGGEGDVLPPVRAVLRFAGVGDDGAGPYLCFRPASPGPGR